MNLESYLRERELTLSDFARTLLVTPEAVRRYVSGERLPTREIMARIVAATGGAVTPNDFFESAGGEPSPPAGAGLAKAGAA